MPFKIAYRVTMQSTKGAGWSMNFWHPASDWTKARSAALALAPALWNLMGSTAFLPSYRISQVGVFRAVQNILYPGGTVLSTFNGDADYPSSALLIKLYGTATTNYATEQWIRGIRDEALTKGGIWAPANSPQTVNAFTVFCNVLVAQGFSLRCLDQTTTGQPVLNFNYSLGTFTTPNNTNPIINPGAGNYVRIKGMGKGSPANGVFALSWVIPTLPATPFAQIPGWIPSTYAPTKVPKKPLCTQQVYIYPLVNNSAGSVSGLGGDIIRGTSHKTGRPTEVLSGRRKARAI